MKDLTKVTVEDVVERYMGVWPEYIPGFAQECLAIGICLKEYQELNKTYLTGEVELLGEDYDPKYWGEVCRKEEFIDVARDW